MSRQEYDERIENYLDLSMTEYVRPLYYGPLGVMHVRVSLK